MIFQLLDPIKGVFFLLLVDHELKERIKNDGLLQDIQENNIFNIGYDLICDGFSRQPNDQADFYKLLPGESVFVRSKETLQLPTDLCAHVCLRNSRIRQGLSLEAPVYQPGHKTRVFFRITNISSSEITLYSGEGIASIFFELLHAQPDKPYNGTYQGEFNYTGMGQYAPQYVSQMKQVEDRLADLKNMEKSVYGNVVTLMTIFIGIFSLVNLNLTAAHSATWSMAELLMYNLCIIGGIFTLAGLIRVLVPPLHHKSLPWWYWLAPVVCFGVSLLLAVLP